MLVSNRRPARPRALRLAVAVLAGGLGWSSVASHAQAQALQQVPADALVVLKINHLSDTNGKLAQLMQDLGASDLKPELKDPLKSFCEQTGVPLASLDGKRDAAVYLPNPSTPGADQATPDEPPLVMLLPVSDYKAFLGGLNEVKTDGEVSSGKWKSGNDDTFYIAHWGDYAAVADKKELLSGKHDGLTPAAAAGRELDARDLCLYVNFPALKPLLLPKLAGRKSQAMTEMDRKLADVEPSKKALAHSAADQAFAVLERFLQDAGPTTVGLSLGKAGVAADMVVAFDKGSYLANLFGPMKTTAGPLLAGLPDEKYLFFGGSVQDPKVMTKLFDDVLGPITAKLGALGENGVKTQGLIDTYKSAMANSEGGAVGMIVPTAALGQGSLVRYVAVLRADAQKLKAAQEQMTQVQQDVMAGFGIPGADLMKTTITKDAKKVGGVSFDLLKTEVDPAANNGQAAQAQQAMQYVYGPDGQAVMLGVVNEHTLLSTMGLDDDTLAGVVKAATDNKDVLSAQVKSVDAEMPKERAAVAYLDLGQLFGTVLSYAHAMGMNMNVDLQPNLPPVGMSFGTDADASGLRFDGFMPTSLLQGLTKAGYQIYLQVPHGGGGGM